MARIKADGAGFYHCMSRAIEGRFILETREKEHFLQKMRRLEDFCGLRIITYSILDSHWHILLEVPDRQEITDTELIRRIEVLYDAPVAGVIRSEFERARESGDSKAIERFRIQYTRRMYDLSEFMKTLKQSFSQYFNKKSGRKGPLWEQRFKSILVEGSEHALSTMAAYIDLNAVRAGIVKDPKDYRWSGYGEAMGGSRQARKGLGLIVAGLGIEGCWDDVRNAYRKHLYVQGERKGIGPDGEALRPGFSKEQVKAVLEAGGRLPRHEILRCRVRYFSDGLVLGSKDFVEKIFGRYRDQFGPRREAGARAMRYADWDGLSTMRDLRKAVIQVPVTA